MVSLHSFYSVPFQLNDLLKEKLQPYLRSVDKAGLPQSIVTRSHDQGNKVSLCFYF